MQADAHVVPPLQFHNPADSLHVCGCDRPALQNPGDNLPETLPAGGSKGEIPQFRVHLRPNLQSRYCPAVDLVFKRVNRNSPGPLVNLPANRNQLHFFVRLCGFFLPLLPAIANFARVQVCAAPRAFPVRLPP